MCVSFGISTIAILPNNSSYFSALIPIFPGLLTQIFSFVNLSPFLIDFIVTIVANAKSIVTYSSFKAVLLPPNI